MSYQSTGIVVLENGEERHRGRIKTNTADGPTVVRAAKIRDRVLEILRSTGAQLVAVEGYAFSKQIVLAHQAGELGGIVRLALVEAGFPVVQVPPAVLKKFVTGRGNAPKEEMTVAVYRRWGAYLREHDEADAYGLAQVAAALAGDADRLTKFQVEALDSVDISLCPTVEFSFCPAGKSNLRRKSRQKRKEKDKGA